MCNNERSFDTAGVLLPSKLCHLDLTSFISRRIIKGDEKQRISRPIVRIATWGVAVGVMLMILSVAIVKGFQNEVRGMVIGFGSHFQVVSNRDNVSKDSQRLLFDKSVYENLKKIEGVKHVQVFAAKPGIIESKEGLQGVAIKGVDKDYDWQFINSVLKEGKILDHDSLEANQVVLSTILARKLRLSLGDKVSIYFVNDQNDARQRNFTIVGIYETGLEDYDSQYVFTDIGHVQKLSGWGLQAQLLIDTVCTGDYIMVGAAGFGGDGFYSFEWSNPEWSGEGPHFLQAAKDTSFYVVLRDGEDTQQDTAFATIDFIDDNATNCSPFVVSTSSGGGSQSQYIGGYEVLINDYEQLLSADDRIFNSLPYDLQVFKVTDRSPEIFSWLAMLDINVIIIIILMIVISIVNMTSALLIIILERQQMIGTLKALGATDGPIVKVFVVHAMVIIGKGMLIGNIIGIGFAVIQYYFHIIPLDPANYYVDTVPIELVWLEFLLLNIGVVIVCFAILLIPAKYVSRITPIKSIRFS
ncbi:MAG: ABC transporter permease [Flavobacteriales bacterium]|jgi:lipoprotein-releasing system permease protein